MTDWQGKDKQIIATGTSLYDGLVPHGAEIILRPAEFAASRYDDDDRLDEMRPIPETENGYLFHLVAGGTGGDFDSLSDAMAWADAQPWGPVTWVMAVQKS